MTNTTEDPPDELLDQLPWISIKDGMKARTGLATPLFEKLTQPQAANVINLGLHRLFRSKSPWEN